MSGMNELYFAEDAPKTSEYSKNKDGEVKSYAYHSKIERENSS